MSSAQAPARSRPAASAASSTRPATRAARPRKAAGPYPGPDDQWQERGACRTANPSLFYAPENENNHQRRFRESAAKAVCAHCPVRAICRAYALQAGELYGIWGGTTERERQIQQNSAGPESRPPRRASRTVGT
jgi:WhiB family transcriptional regulator, redox-sensing transcriptional regulator